MTQGFRQQCGQNHIRYSSWTRRQHGAGFGALMQSSVQSSKDVLQRRTLTLITRQSLAAAAAEFICHEKNIHVYINVKDRRAARK